MIAKLLSKLKMRLTMLKQDTVAPALVTGIKKTASTVDTVSLEWNKSDDNKEVKEYVVFYREVCSIVDPSFRKINTDESFATLKVNPGQITEFFIEAIDSSGNKSIPSNPCIVTTGDSSTLGEYYEGYTILS